jgi:hypothetical protein
MFQAKKYTQPWSNAYQVNTIKQEIIRSCDTFKKKQLLSEKIDLSVFTEKGLGLLKKQQINQHQTELLNKEKISRLAITVHQPVIDQPTDRPPADPQPLDPPPAMARYEWPDPAETADATSSWYRTLPAMIGFFFLVSILTAVGFGLFTFFVPQIEEISIIYKIIIEFKKGLASSIMLSFLSSISLCVYGAVLQNELYLPNPQNLIQEVFSIDKNKENTQKIFGYVRLKIFYLLPKDFYEKMFKRINYKNLLEDLKEKNVLTIEEINTLNNADMNSHPDIVNKWAKEIVSGSKSAKAAFMEFDKECANFKSKYFKTKNCVDNVFVPIAMLVLCINFLSHFVVFTGQETVEQILELFPFQSVILNFFVLVIFYVGVYTIDVFNVNNYFFNGIKKNAVDIKEFYEEQERKLEEVYFSP